MAMPINTQTTTGAGKSPALPPEKASSAMMMRNGDVGGYCNIGGVGVDDVAERQAVAIVSTAKRALKEEAEAGAGVGVAAGNKLSVKKSLEWFLESRRKRKTAAAAAAGTLSSSS